MEKYKGLTKRKYKQLYGSSTSGSEKGDNCKASSLDKALIKYPRSRKTMTALYQEVYRKKDKACGRKGSHATFN